MAGSKRTVSLMEDRVFWKICAEDLIEKNAIFSTDIVETTTKESMKSSNKYIPTREILQIIDYYDKVLPLRNLVQPFISIHCTVRCKKSGCFISDIKNVEQNKLRQMSANRIRSMNEINLWHAESLWVKTEDILLGIYRLA